MSPQKNKKTIAKPTPDPELNQIMEELLVLQQQAQDRIAFSQRIGKIGTFTWNVKTNDASWTKEFESLYGYNKEGISAGDFTKWTKYVHPEDRERVVTETKAALIDKEEMSIEFRIIWPDKTVHFILMRAQIIRDSEGIACEVSGVNIDISERKQNEKNLEYLDKASKTLSSSLDYNQTLKAVVELSVPEIADWCSIDMLNEHNEIKRLAVAHVDPKKVKWAWELYRKNPPTMDADTGLPQVLKTGIAQFFPIITKEMIEASKPTPEVRKVLDKLDLHSVMIIPLIVEGKPNGAITFVNSESGRYFSQADMTVAKEVASRASLAIHNARLFTDSQAAISIRDEFISVASHELKTPVTSLKMYTQIVLKQIQQQNEMTLINPILKMNAQIDKLTLLINDLLNISKIQLGKLEFNEKYFNLYQVLEDTIESVQSSTPTHHISLNGTKDTEVWGDKERISQVITNFLTNAIKYSPKANKVLVTITPKKDMVTVSFKDFGIGIDKEQQQKIFNRFYRVGGPEEKTFPGLGIGLYISSEIINRHHGKINVTSEKGKGSSFSFSLPYHKHKPSSSK